MPSPAHHPSDDPDPGDEDPSPRSTQVEEAENADSPRGFLRDIFRFLFGDGLGTRKDHHHRSMTAIGHMIRRQSRGPVVTAKQMAPYLDEYIFHEHDAPPGRVPDRYTRHEGFVLPVLRCFHGQAEASDDGQTLEYHFPELGSMETSVPLTVRDFELSTLSKRAQPIDDGQARYEDLGYAETHLEEGGEDPPILEHHLVFFYTRQTVALGIWNLVQVFLLGWFLFFADTEQLMRDAQFDPSMAQFVLAVLGASQFVYWYLLAYALFYLLFPASRYWYQGILNRRIDRRNQKRIRVVAEMHSSDPRTAPTFAASHTI